MATADIETPEGVYVPEPAAGAPREQLMEFAALCGVFVATGGSIHNDVMSRVLGAYMSRWHPDAWRR